MNNLEKILKITKPMSDKQVQEMVEQKYSFRENASLGDEREHLVIEQLKLKYQSEDKVTTQTQDFSGV